MNSHSASVFHSQLAGCTRQARLTQIATPVASDRRPRVSEAAVWKLMDNLRSSTGLVDKTLPLDRAVRRVLVDLLASARPRQRLTMPPICSGPVLVIRSGPWPVLRALLDHLAAAGDCTSVTVICHRRDQSLLEASAASTAVPIEPCYYPRFEPFSPVTLKRLIAEHRKSWTAAFMLDGSRGGTGQQLEHMAPALDGDVAPAYVWNASGSMYRLLRLRETLGEENYALVRRLLRWHAGRSTETRRTKPM